ncbi:helix-turn-helix transcriptional regulator [Paenibacillus alkaliterrae]|uniref:helix-turn-helix domain-containing protein n=1 Tax=Paenibacillus alkaliterrae TaxID=320909 RepID=UPI001F485CB6|nr:helix-turn-helix transcriptional regulator [Paenibacillus alkaliterrae]MCF2939782.1 helix-turn-helix transcriptional regulator [Paenibacillus alkaliterrae]
MSTTLYKDLGAKLRTARESCDLTQSKAAQYLGIARELISYYENGTRQIDLLTLNKLSNLYGFPVEHFLSNESQDDSTVALAFRSNGLSETDLDVLARANEFLHNLNWLNKVLNGRSES